MTNNQLNRERLEKIKSWRETYGAGSNVMLPAEEAEELARIALAAMDSEPVAWDHEWASCITWEGPQKFNRVIEREAPPEWAVDEGRARNIIPLYRHAQPAPDDVQRDAKRWRALLGSARIRILGSAGFDATAHPGENPDYRHFGMEIWTHYPNWLHEKNEYGIDTLTQYADAMLAAAPHDTPALNSLQSIDSVADRWIPVSERMPETDGNYWGWWSESKRQGPVWFIKSELQAQFQSHEITHWMPLPAAPQEVKGE